MAPLTSYDWANFQVFEDPCTLDQAIFSPGQLKDSVLGFCRWVDRLRTQLQRRHPGLGGIPDEVAGDVLHLLNHFFPSANGVDGYVNKAIQINAMSFAIEADETYPPVPLRLSTSATVNRRCPIRCA
jgi:hypothetical protein